MIQDRHEDYAVYNRLNMSQYLVSMFSKMGFGLLITFLTSIVAGVFFPNFTKIFLLNPISILAIMFLEIGIVFFMNKKVAALDTEGVDFLYYLFAFINGLFLSYIYFFYYMSEIMGALFTTCVFFFTLAAYGHYTKKNLAHWGSLLRVALMAISVISLAQIIGMFFGFQSTFLSLLVSCATVIVLSLYVAYDMQTMREFYFSVVGNKKAERVISTMGAFNMYLNFLIIFQRILRIIAHTREKK